MDRIRRRICCVRVDAEQDALRERVAQIDEELGTIYRIFPPRRVSRYLKLERRIGAGGYGTVFRSTVTLEGLNVMPALEAGCAYAVKKIAIKKRGHSEEISRSLIDVSVERHLEFVNLLRAPETAEAHIIRFFAFLLEIPRNMYQVMEMLEGPDLFDFVAGRSATVSEPVAARLIRQVFTAIHYLHRKVGALHRDIKPENFGFLQPVPFEEEGLLPDLKLFDFGLAWVLPEPVTEETSSTLLPLARAGTLLYMAPETWLGRSGPPSDVWSAGLVSYLLLSSDLPFGLLGSRLPVQAVGKNPLTFGADTWSRLSDSAQQLVEQMLQKDPQMRVSTSTVLESPWLEAPGNAPSCLREASTMPTRLRQSNTHTWESAVSWQTVANSLC